jgi:hypothetical protein
MTNINLALDYMKKAINRLEALEVYLNREDYAE